MCKKYFLLILLLSMSLSVWAEDVFLPVPTNQIDALKSIYHNTDGPNWQYQDNWLSQDVCTWKGVKCYNRYLYGEYTTFYYQVEIRELYLGSKGLKGTLPDAIGQLTELQILSVTNNSELEGEIPASIANLKDLRWLFLENNQFTGPLPYLNSKLTRINLSGNQFSGSIPANIGDLSEATGIQLSQNNLTGSIPQSIGQLQKLQFLNLSNNQLSGDIPGSLGNLAELTDLWLGFNQFSGSIPSELGLLEKLKKLLLYANQLTGQIPQSIGGLHQLTQLDLSGNQLEGPLPQSLGQLTKLTSLRISNNRLNGELPKTLGNLNNLEIFYLNDNRFHGALPIEMSGMTSMWSLRLRNNQFSGAVPDIFAAMTNLQIFDARNNHFSGGLPPSALGYMDRTGFTSGFSGNAYLGGPLTTQFTTLYPNLTALLINQPSNISKFGDLSCFSDEPGLDDTFENSGHLIYSCVKNLEKTCPEAGTGASCLIGNPINIRTGVKQQSATDYSGAGNSPLSITRSYNSQDRQWQFFYQKRWLKITGNYVKMQGNRPTQGIFHCPSLGNCYSEQLVKSPIKRGGYRLSKTENSYILSIISGGSETYDLNGTLIATTSASGHVSTYTSTGEGVTISDEFDQQLTIIESDGLVSTIDTPIGRFNYAYTSNALLHTVTRPDGTTIKYLYDEPQYSQAPADSGLLTGKIDAKGQRSASWYYDDKERAYKSEHGQGVDVSEVFYISEAGTPTLADDGTVTIGQRIREVTGPLGQKIRYTFKSPQGIQAEKIEYFDAQGNLDSTEHYQFSTDGFVSQFTDKFGRITQYTRDGFGRETKRVENVGTYQEKTTVISYSEGAQKPSLIDDGNTRWQMNYIWHATEQLITTRHQIDKATRDYRTTTYQYNANGQLTKIDGPRSDVDDSITYGYNAQGQKISVTNALGHQSKILSYNLQGLPTETVDANNIATTYQYDDMGRLTSQTKQGATTTISYDSNNNPLTLSGPNGSILNFHYDNANRLVAQTNEKGERVDFQLDASGNRIARTIKDKNGLLRFVENHQFDEFDRLQTIIDGNNASEVSSYLPGGLKSTNTDALGYITNYQYDSVAQLEQVTDANGGLTSYQYDQWGQTLSVTDAEGKTTSYQYNGFGELIEQHSPDTGTTQYSYDKAGNLSQTTHVESGKTISLKYDALNRIISDSARGVTYGYDQGVNGVGKLTSISDSNSTQQLSYDGNGNLVSDSYTIGGKTFTVTYQYNSASQLTGMTYPDGRTVEMTLNSSGQTTQLTTTDNGTSTVLASNIQYLPFGPMSSFDYGNGLSLSQTFDLNYNLSERNTSGIEALLYALSPRHEIESISDSLVSGNTQQFTYSPMQQLETAQGPYGQLSFSYDQIGNRLSRSNDTGTTQYSYQADSHRLKTLSGVENENFSYDARGQVIAKNNHSFSYDDAGRLSTFNNGSSVTSYQYNYRNLRSGKTSDGNTKHYIYNPAGMLLAEISSNGNVVVQYIYLNGQLLSVVYNSDYAGSPLPDLLYGYDDLSEYAYSQGQWSQSKSRNAFAGSHQTASGNSGSTFHWEPSLYDGVYEVYAQWIDNRKNAKQAVYRINHNNKTDTVLVNQSQNGGQLQLLGTFDFDGSPGEGVILSDENGKVSADLISVKRVADMPKESTLYLVHNDHLGTPTRLSNLNAEVVWKADYTPFGLAMVDEDADGNGSSITFNIRMPGQYFDSESNLHYNWYRYYDPSIGRYIQSDPIGLAGGINTYGYVSNNPMNFIDPMGLIERKLNKSEKRKLKIAVESIKCLGAEYEAKDLFSMIETNQIVIDTELMEKGAYGKAHEFFRGFSLAPELFEQNNAVIVGITAHEYAHVVEFNYAGSFAKLMLYPLAVFGIYDREKGPDVAETAILKKYFESDCQCDG